MKTNSSCTRSERGSVLIVALIFSALIAVALGSYLNLGTSAMQLSHRSLYNNAAMNLAETGLEEGMWSINQILEDNANAWTSWTTVGTNDRRRTFGPFSLEQGVTGSVIVYVQNAPASSSASGAAPIIHTRATVTLPRGPAIEKWITVELTRRSLFANGLLAKTSISFSGNGAKVDSYDSRNGAYGGSNVFAEGPAASMSVQADTFNLGNADIYGYVSVGTTTVDAGLNVGPNGTVSGTLGQQGVIDYDRTTPNFTANLEDATAPAAASYTANPIINTIGSMTLPRATDVPTVESDGTEIYYITANAISISGNNTNKLVIEANKNVVIILTPTTGTSISLTGQSSIQIDANATLNIYTEADVAIGGNGIANNTSNPPANFMLWGTRPASAASAQNISIAGNGQLSAVVYAPNANVTANGGGSSGNIQGAIVGNTITVTGGSAFHYDMALAELNDEEPFGISVWNELTSATARSAVASKFN
jgi:hypothetical protein